MLSALGHPERRFASVHIAGTNGKGSVTAILSRVLLESGFSVGRFTSPHLHSYRERYVTGESMIEAGELMELIGRVQPAVAECQSHTGEMPTEFEILTAVGFLYFAEKNVDIAVIEAGMGGLYDSTNVLTPVVSVITNVDADHLAYLGPKLEDVARNKAGIARQGVPLLYGRKDDPVWPVIQAEAGRLGARAQLAADQVRVTPLDAFGPEGTLLEYQSLSFSGGPIRFALPGTYQIENLTTALAALDVICAAGFSVNQAALERGLGLVKWPGRMEVIPGSVPIVLDCAHNPAGAAALADSLRRMFPNGKRIMVIGILDDKEAVPVLETLAEDTRYCIVTRPDSDRAAGWFARIAEAKQAGMATEGIESIEKAVAQALRAAQPGEYIVVTGSFYTLDRARKYLLALNDKNLTCR